MTNQSKQIDELNNNLSDELYYKEGDIITVTSDKILAGVFVNSSKDLFFTIPLPKRFKKNHSHSFSISGTNFFIRGVSGPVLGTGNFNSTKTNYNFTFLASENFLTIQMSPKNSQAFGVTDDTPSTVGGDLTITINWS